MGDGDAVVHLNFRADRARQLTQALALDGFTAFDRGRRPADLLVATLTEYQAPDELPVPVAFPPVVIDSLAAYLSRLGLRQLHLAETEKYAHVTYFFNGGVEAPLPGEDRVLVPSRRDVPTYDLAPQMSAPEITERLVAAIGSGDYDFIIVNYANPDMVGHTGVWDAAVAAAEVIDGCLDQVSRATLRRGRSAGHHRRPRQHRGDARRGRCAADPAHHLAGAAGAGGGALARGQPARRDPGRRGADPLRADGAAARAVHDRPIAARRLMR